MRRGAGERPGVLDPWWRRQAGVPTPVPVAQAGERLRQARTLLLIKPGDGLADGLAVTPLIRNLRAGLPNTRFVLVAGPRIAPALRDEPDLDRVFTADLQGPLAGWRYLRLGRRLRAESASATLLLATSRPHPRVLALARAARSGWIIGLDDGTEGAPVYDCTVPLPEEPRSHIVDHYLSLIEGFGLPVPDREHHVTVTIDQRLRGADHLRGLGLDPERPILGVQVGGAAPGSRDGWGPAQFAAILQRAARDLGMQTVILGEARDREAIEQVLALGHTSIPRLLDLPVPDTKGVLSHLSFFLSLHGDTAHLAAGVGVPMFIVFLVDTAWRWAPYGSHVAVWEESARAPSVSEVWERIQPALRAAGGSDPGVPV